MNYFNLTTKTVMTFKEVEAARLAGSTDKVVSRHDFNSLQDAQDVVIAFEGTGVVLMATDAGEWCSPRFDIIEAPKVGDAISYAYNGDYYPCGHIATISKTMKRIVSTEGHIFTRRRLTGAWLRDGMWTMVSGHVNKWNPEF